ncbi:hypothetical protein O6H91_Y151500 [Diphasiastrum complanatum]|nr:hypothetical protein O6H91_Y151500 [Diphasiastrum complanatum]
MMQQNLASMQSPSSISSMPESALTYDEVSMQRSQDFFMALQELKNLRPQLYSAAEYCESSYIYSDQKQAVLENLKDYSVKALVNAVDHLGTVAYKLNDLLSQQTSELATTEIRVSCLSQRLLACQEFTDREGLTQQILVKEFPKHHKHYTFPDPNDPEDSLNAAQFTLEGDNSVEVGQKANSHPFLEVNKPDNTNGYYPRKGTGTEAEIVSDADSKKVPVQQQKSKQGAAEAQIDSKSEAPQNIQQSKSDGYRPSSTANTGDIDSGKIPASSRGVPPVPLPSAKSKSGPMTPVMQHNKSVIDDKRSLSTLMSFEEGKFRQLRQPHSRSKSVLFSLLGKKKGGKQSKKVLNSHNEAL